MEIMDRNFRAPYQSHDEASTVARAINASLRESDGTLHGWASALERHGWIIPQKRMRALARGLDLLHAKRAGQRARFQVLLRYSPDRTVSGNWCLWVECTAPVDKRKPCTARARFWTRWNAAFSCKDLDAAAWRHDEG